MLDGMNNGTEPIITWQDVVKIQGRIRRVESSTGCSRWPVDRKDPHRTQPPAPKKEDLAVRIAVAIEKLVEVCEAYLPPILSRLESMDPKLDALPGKEEEDEPPSSVWLPRWRPGRTTRLLEAIEGGGRFRDEPEGNHTAKRGEAPSRPPPSPLNADFLRAVRDRGGLVARSHPHRERRRGDQAPGARHLEPF